MRVAIVGAGAMGGLYAAKLAKVGHEVTVVDASREVVDAVNNDGLIVESADGNETVPVRATSQPGDIGPVSTVFFFVKAHQTAAAAEQASPLVNLETTVVSLQNGWGNADILARTYPARQIVIGVTYHSATVLAPGRIAHTATNPTFVGPYKDGAPLDLGMAVRDLLVGAGFEVALTPEIKTEIWKKLVLNAATLPPSALTRLQAGNLGQPGPLLDFVDGLAAEAVEVACAQGYDIAFQERIDRIHAALIAAGRGKGSMLQDVETRRKTEIEVINGAVVRAAEHVGVAAPLNRAMVALVGGLERSWQQ